MKDVLDFISARKGRLMSQYLIFQLHGPMASWGVDAPGEVRHTHELPSRSALLGLLAAGVRIRRDDTEQQARLIATIHWWLRQP